MALRKSTRNWLIVFGVSLAAATVLGRPIFSDSGCARIVAINLAIAAALVLVFRGLVASFRAIIRKLTLRLAFSYFLIGIVPIPLIGALIFAGAYLVAHQIVATRLHREIVAAGREAAAPGETRPAFRIDSAARVAESDVDWLPKGSAAEWARTLTAPRPVLQGEVPWLVVPVAPAGRFVLIRMAKPDGEKEAEWIRRIEERTGYEVHIQVGTSRRADGLSISMARKGVRGKSPDPDFDVDSRPKAAGKPEPAPAAPRGLLDRKWIAGVYIDTPVATFQQTETGRRVVLDIARTSPRILFDQLFEQGVPEIGRAFWAVFIFLSSSLLLVYLVALGIAFGLVGALARNVNRLTRASAAVSRGDFTVRVNSKSRDQVGDLARSFDGMAASIQGLLVETAQKERLEAELAIARTIQQKLLPPPEAELPGLRLRARFEPLAEIGGDYYDYVRLPEERGAIAVGDVSGHGLSTGLLVAMAKAGLSTLLESGFRGTELFVKLNELIHRSTDSRNYMTLALFTYDPATRTGTLTNAGQLAPYRISPSGEVDSLSLPSFPLGMSPRSDFPTREWKLSSGDRLVFLTDGLVEAANPAGDPFGFERLEALLRAEAGADASELEQAILRAVAEHSAGTAPEDDRTLVIVTLD